ncbi:hypothetical protein HanPI659440_Chr08g0306301 [Helianthus annuus]|nr:hypothetical protein HanPI659440_Chr08g0306301 [Helianthus annuus]
MYAVRVMNFLETLNQYLVIELSQASPRESQSDENSGQGLDCIHTCNKILMKIKRENMNSSLKMIIFNT